MLKYLSLYYIPWILWVCLAYTAVYPIERFFFTYEVLQIVDNINKTSFCILRIEKTRWGVVENYFNFLVGYRTLSATKSTNR